MRVDLLRGSKVVKRVLKLRTRKAARTYTLKIAPKGLKAGNYTLRLRATRAGKTTTLKLPVTRTAEARRVGLAGRHRARRVPQRVRGRGHRLEADDVGDRGREHLRVGVAALEHDLDPAPPPCEHERPAVRLA